MRNPRSKTIFVLLCIIALIALPGTAGTVSAISSQTITPPSTRPEGADFATSILRDPWDMSQYTDVSQYVKIVWPAQFGHEYICVKWDFFRHFSWGCRDRQCLLLSTFPWLLGRPFKPAKWGVGTRFQNQPISVYIFQ